MGNTHLHPTKSDLALAQQAPEAAAAVISTMRKRKKEQSLGHSIQQKVKVMVLL